MHREHCIGRAYTCSRDAGCYDVMRMSKRRSIEIPGLEHVHPIPNACRIGELLMTGGIYGKDPRHGQAGGGHRRAVRVYVRQHPDACWKPAAPAPEDVIKIHVWMKSKEDRDHLNREWLAMFPDPHSRPTRHTFKDEDQPYGALVSCEVIAVIGCQ